MLQTQKDQTTSKQIVLKGRFVFSMQEVLNIAREAEKATVEKKLRIQQCKQPTVITVKQQEDKVIEDISSNSDSDCIIVQLHRLY